MKAITLYQPWASLLACGAKQFETRSWATNYRGQIAIHAAKKPYNLGDIDFGLIRGFMPAVENALGIYEAINAPLGVIIATAELVECHEMKRNPEDDAIYIRDISRMFEYWISPKDDEYLFGDWTPGRYAWEFTNMKMLLEPIPAKGHQRLWEWEGTP